METIEITGAVLAVAVKPEAGGWGVEVHGVGVKPEAVPGTLRKIADRLEAGAGA